MNIYSCINSILRRLNDASYLFRYPQLKHAFRCQTHLTREERVCLYQLAQGKRNILEIGSYIGASACCFGAASRTIDFSKIFCVDTWNNDAMSEGNRNTWSEFLSNAQPYIVNIVPIKGHSVDMAVKVMAHTDELDLLFIDGDHSYEGVKSDWVTAVS